MINYNYNEVPYSIYPIYSYDGDRIKTEQDLAFVNHPPGMADPWIQLPQILKPHSEAMPLYEIPENPPDWSEITPPISPGHGQSNEHEAEAPGLRIPFVPSRGRKRRSTSTSRRTRARNPKSTRTLSSDLSSSPGTARPAGSKSIEASILYQLLIELRETRQLSWKDCAEVIKKRGKAYKVPALQMRYKRLKEKAVVWEPEDVRIRWSITLIYSLVHNINRS